MKKLILLSVLLQALNLSATIINVPSEQPTIQAGIDASVDADTVLVQPGTYYENINFSGKNITLGSLFLIIQDTTYISQTIINGNQNGSVVIFENGEDNSTVLMGLAITNGDAFSGGGIKCSDSSDPILANLLIFENQAELGGGIYSSSSSTNPHIINTKIYNNSTYGFGTSRGGGIHSSTSHMIIENTEIINNSASYGGGVYFNYDHHSNLLNLIISNNSADVGGGVYFYNSEIVLENIIIHDNQASNVGGGIYNYWDANPSMENVSIANNSAQLGGGIYCNHNSGFNFSSVNRCNIYQNNQVSNRGVGRDIFMDDCEILNVIVDTFTVLNPSDHFASPIDNFTFDILNEAQNDLVNSDLYVSVSGDNSNSGTNQANPLKNINFALSKIYADSSNHHTIYLAPGTYSPTTNEETFPIELNNYVSLEGIEGENTILDAENTNGVLSLHYVSNTEIKNITIKNGEDQNYPQNTRGSGVYCYESSPSFINVSFSENIASPSGGGFISYYSNPCFENVIFSGNNAWLKGGAIYCYQSDLTILNSEIVANSANGIGGGIASDESIITLINVELSENTTNGDGGGIYSDDSDLNLLNVIVSNNSSSGIRLSYSNMILINALLSNNDSSLRGSTICSSNSFSSLINVTLSESNISERSNIIFCSSSELNLVNCILWNELLNEIYCDSLGFQNVINISYTDLDGSETGIITQNNAVVNWLNGNIDENPIFDNFGNYPFAILENSPCINAGTLDLPGGIELPEYDLVGNPRIYGETIDMGAYENQNVVVGILDESLIPITPRLKQNYPNPFNPETTINYSLADEGNIELTIYNIKGQKIKQLVRDQLSAGQHSVIWDGRDKNDKQVNTGIYYYKLRVNGKTEAVKKCLLLK